MFEGIGADRHPQNDLEWYDPGQGESSPDSSLHCL